VAPTIEISDARRSAADREWVRNVYPLYLHDLSEFDDGYYRLSERGLWEPDPSPTGSPAGRTSMRSSSAPAARGPALPSSARRRSST
jgi:hypothetical protein